jgi:hypothetical protein
MLYFATPGQACFIYELEPNSHAPPGGTETHSLCSKCGSQVLVDQANGQCLLEHMGAHMLYDPSIDHSQELCGLCLRLAPMCMIFLKKGWGAAAGYSVDISQSTCINLMCFNYATAAWSSEVSPCSNIPILCPLCPTNSLAVWRYSMHSHF